MRISAGLSMLAALAGVATAPPASAGSYQPVFSFNGGDGSGPSSALIDVGGTLYGTAVSGGTYGDGTVFAYTP